MAPKGRKGAGDNKGGKRGEEEREVPLQAVVRLGTQQSRELATKAFKLDPSRPLRNALLALHTRTTAMSTAPGKYAAHRIYPGVPS
jgi:hypothetical protein